MTYKQQKFISPSSGGWEVLAQVPAGLCSGGGSLLGSLLAPPQFVSRGGRSEGFLWSRLCDGTNPLPQGSTLVA